ncbi:long-chain fatty acid--CoA ligase [Bradyrhizobium sp. KB893862 SZCCT0404]|nr:long-chain fatty acid--CoA ligase [Bradyrhizobium sp. KB893862 SZCCT0404]
MYLTQLLRRACQIAPARRSTVDATRIRTWSETVDRVARFAGFLLASGLEPGDRVAILSLNNDRYFEALFAIPWAGGVVVPINTRLSPAEVDGLLKDSGTRTLIVDHNFVEMIGSLASARDMRTILQFDGAHARVALPFDQVIAATEPAADRLRGGDELAGIYYTGGTTGRPKGVMLSHANLVTNALNMSLGMGFESDAVYLHAAPMFHLSDSCSTYGLTMFGGTHVFMPRFDPLAFFGIVQDARITNVTLVPTMISMILNHERVDEFDLSSLKRVCFGAAPMSNGLLQRVLDKLGHVRFQQAWGMTELSPIATLMEARFTTAEHLQSGRLRSCGQAVATAEVAIVDEAGAELPRGTTGEVVVRGPIVMKGYWQQPETTAAVLRGGWMHSGDAGYMDEDGFVYIVDRLKDMIVTGGENVYSAEVENTISLMPEIAEVAVIGVPDDTWGEAVFACVVPRESADLSPEQVIAFCREHLAAFKCPRGVQILDRPLPTSAAGKVLKTELRRPFWSGRERGVN